MRYARLVASGALLALVALLGSMSTAIADDHRSVEVVSGNPSCTGGLKIEPVVSGTYGPITIVVSGSTFSFTTDGSLVTTVVVKGGPNANMYSYPAGVTSDSGLSAPVNSANGKPYGLSHLCFFVGDKKEEPPKK